MSYIFKVSPISENERRLIFENECHQHRFLTNHHIENIPTFVGCKISRQNNSGIIISKYLTHTQTMEDFADIDFVIPNTEHPYLDGIILYGLNMLVSFAPAVPGIFFCIHFFHIHA